MVAKLLSSSRLKWLKFSIIFVIFFIIAMVVYFPNFARLKKLRDENKKLVLENKKLEEEIADYEEKLKKLGQDSYLYEKIAREDLGVAKENEIVIDIEQ